MLNANCNFQIRNWFMKKKIFYRELNIYESFTKVTIFYQPDIENTETIVLNNYNRKTKEHIQNMKNLGLSISLGNVNNGMIISFIIENTPDEIFSILKVQGEL